MCSLSDGGNECCTTGNFQLVMVNYRLKSR